MHAKRCPTVMYCFCEYAASVKPKQNSPHSILLACVSPLPLSPNVIPQQNKKGEAPQQSKKEESKKNKRARYAVDNQKTLLERQQVCMHRARAIGRLAHPVGVNTEFQLVLHLPTSVTSQAVLMFLLLRPLALPAGLGLKLVDC